MDKMFNYIYDYIYSHFLQYSQIVKFKAGKINSPALFFVALSWWDFPMQHCLWFLLYPILADVYFRLVGEGGGGVRAVTMLSGDWVVWWLGGVGVAACRDSWGRVSGEAGGLHPNSRPRCARASSSKVYPAGKLHCHFTCGFNFGHSLSLPFVGGFTVLELWLIVPVGTIGCFQPGVNPFKIVGEPMGCVQSRELGARPFCLPSLILLGSISLVTLYLWFPF